MALEGEPLDHEALHHRLVDRRARVGIVGLGYVGLPLARAFSEAGFDIDPSKIEAVNAGRSWRLPDLGGMSRLPITK